MQGRTAGRNKALLIVLAIFSIGFTAGALSMNLYNRTASPPPATPRAVIFNRMNDRLSLTNNQQASINAILKDTFEQYGELRGIIEPCLKESRPRFDAIREGGREKIRALLTPEQLPKYEQLTGELDAERENFFRGRKKEQ